MLKEKIYDYYKQIDSGKKPKVFDQEKQIFFNPSSFNACKRQIYCKKQNIIPSNPIDSASYLKMDFGSTLHTRIQDIIANMHILMEAEELRVKEFNGLQFRYKTDGIIILNSEPHIMEIKTTHAGGLRAVKYDPKPEDVVQMSLYMLFEGIKKGVLLYVGRDNGYLIEYYITQECDAYKVAIAEINRKCEELKVLERNIKNGVMPGRDGFIEMKNTSGKISEKFQKDKVAHRSDWRCSYCAYKDLCWHSELEEIKTHKFYLNGEFID